MLISSVHAHDFNLNERDSYTSLKSIPLKRLQGVL